MRYEVIAMLRRLRTRTTVGAITGALIGALAVLIVQSSVSDQLFLALVGPWSVADVLNEWLGTPEWFFYLTANAYLAAMGGVVGWFSGRVRPLARVIGTLALLIGHAGITIVGAQHFATVFHRDMQHIGTLPAPRGIFPTSSPRPAR